MNKNKKIMIVIIAIVLLIAIICIAIFLINKKETENLQSNETKLDNIYKTVEDSKNYTLSVILDDNNSLIAYIRGDMARIENNSPERDTITIVKDGNTYLLVPDDEKCYVYKNNTEGLNQVKGMMETIKDVTPTKGKEKIENKMYEYEEYEGVSSFLVNYDEDVDSDTIKTRLYYDDDKLVYVKTTDKDTEQLARINLEYEDDVNNVDFNIPSNYEVIE